MKKLFLLPVAAMLMLAGCTQGGNQGGGGGGPAAPTTISFSAEEFTVADDSATLEKGGLTVTFGVKVTKNEWALDQSKPDEKSWQLRANKNSAVTFSGKSLAKIDFVCQLDYVGDKSTSYYGASGFVPGEGQGEMSADVAGEQTQTGTWTVGETEVTSLTLTASNHQVRVFSFVVTLK